MTAFVDTSGLFALLNVADLNRQAADQAWQALAAGHHTLVCTNYVLLETFALVQNRLVVCQRSSDGSGSVIPSPGSGQALSVRREGSLLACAVLQPPTEIIRVGRSG